MDVLSTMFTYLRFFSFFFSLTVTEKPPQQQNHTNTPANHPANQQTAVWFLLRASIMRINLYLYPVRKRQFRKSTKRAVNKQNTIREREGGREGGRDRQTETERQRQTERQRGESMERTKQTKQYERKRDRERQTDRQTDRQRQR